VANDPVRRVIQFVGIREDGTPAEWWGDAVRLVPVAYGYRFDADADPPTE
jgi:hypothetical protein